MKTRLVGSLFLLVCVSSVPAVAAPCDQLAALALKDATVTSARLISAGEFAPPTVTEGNANNRNAFKNLPAFCRVAATLKPSSDSDINVEVWLPASGWNGKFQAVGNGGWAGAISYPAMADAIRAGYADGVDGYGACRQPRHVCARSSREADRLRMAIGARDDGEGQGRDP